MPFNMLETKNKKKMELRVLSGFSTVSRISNENDNNNTHGGGGGKEIIPARTRRLNNEIKPNSRKYVNIIRDVSSRTHSLHHTIYNMCIPLCNTEEKLKTIIIVNLYTP